MGGKLEPARHVNSVLTDVQVYIRALIISGPASVARTATRGAGAQKSPRESHGRPHREGLGGAAEVEKIAICARIYA